MRGTRFLTDRPMRIKLIISFVPLIVFSVILTGVFSYVSALRQLKENAYSMLTDTTHQTALFLNDKLKTVLEQLILIENDNAFKNMVASSGGTAAAEDRFDTAIAIAQRFEDSYAKYFEMIDSIYLNLGEGREFHLLKEATARHIGADWNTWGRNAAPTDSKYVWLHNHRDEVFDTVERRDVITVFKRIGTDSSAAKGILLFNLRTSYFLNILDNVKISPNGYLVLLNAEGILYSKQPDAHNSLDQAGVQFLRKHTGNSGSFNLRNDSGEKLFVVFESLRVNNWVLAAVVPEHDILDKASHIQYFTLGAVVLLIVISSIIAAMIAGNISGSIRRLARQVRKLEQGDFDVQFELRDHHEIGVLSRGLSHLAETVKLLLGQVIEEQERKRQMELLALQAQITPHFLYNTLGSIRQLIEMKDLERAGRMVNALTKFCMIGVSRGKEMITLREELDHLEYYLQIQKMRYSRDFDYSFDVSPALLDCMLPKLTLQPIIENAIYHGIKNKRGKGSIRISAAAVHDDVEIVIYDNGAGMSRERLEQLSESMHKVQVEAEPITYGLRNSHQRVVLCFGPRYGIAMESVEGGYTSVRVLIPRRSVEGEETNAEAVDRR